MTAKVKLGLFVLSGAAVAVAFAMYEIMSFAGCEEAARAEGFLTVEEALDTPPPDPDVRWVRSDGADLPTQLSPCETPLVSDAHRVAGRQVVLVATDRDRPAADAVRLWKSVRLSVYPTSGVASRAVAEIRAAFTTCAPHGG